MTEYDYQRLPYLVRFEDHSVIKETYARQLNQITLEGHLLRPNDRPSKTLLVFMHPSGLMHYLPMPIAMATMATMADPRWLDPTIDPNDRKPNWCFMGNPQMVNNAPAGLARFCTLRSWLSQWSYDLSCANGPACAKRISVPTLVIGNTAGDGCTPSHTKRIFETIASADKTKRMIQGATHYYFGQPDKLESR
ncbi:MAG: hypothetical protein OSB82_00085 [Alphaproteobacteria bacterium]|nr:hypothetical protein [Alphaproteobacteria bacterium]